ncbi:MAG: hypothetical protein KBT34_12515, partial [Prevotella sp.]|nr:hypothetical protein [Candidatus Prevotella equi]
MANNKCIQINRIEEKSYQVDTFDDQLTIYGKFNTYSGIIKGCSGLTSVVWNAKKCNDFTYKSPFPTTVENITFGDEVEYIPARLCCYITCLTSVTIPNSVTSIG